VGNLRDRIAEPLHVIERDVGDDGNERLDDIRRVQPPAHADFQHGQIHLGFGEGAEGQSGQRLKEAGVARQRAFTDQPSRAVVHAEVVAREGLVGDERAGDPDPFVDPIQMRRGVQARPIAGGQQDRRERGRGGSFAVGPGDEDRAKALLRMPEGGDQRPHLLQPKLAPRLPRSNVQLGGASVKSVEGGGIGHRSVPAEGSLRFYLSGAGTRSLRRGVTAGQSANGGRAKKLLFTHEGVQSQWKS
jgi:hypothetical protein